MACVQSADSTHIYMHAKKGSDGEKQSVCVKGACGVGGGGKWGRGGEWGGGFRLQKELGVM